MAKYKDLSIDGTNDIVPSGGFNEVGAGGMNTPNIKDQSVVNETALNKMATSIPTPFARLYLYDTAFKEFNAKENKPDFKGTAYKSDPATATLYHHLVSECLDLLEFIFEYGNDKLFTIHEWDVDMDSRILGAADAGGNIIIEDNYVGVARQVDEIGEKHKKLATALRDAVLNTKLSGTSKIYIFKWDGIIVGGTSPFTLVYTSPNWRRNMAAGGLKFYGGQGNLLFPPISPTTKVYSLRERSVDFRFYLYSLQNLYPSMSTTPANGGLMWNLDQYLTNSKNNYESHGAAITEALRKYNDLTINGINDHFKDYFRQLKETSTEGGKPERPLIASRVEASGIPFFTKVSRPDTESAYIIKPTVENGNLPIEKNSLKQDIVMADALPLVLSTGRLGNNARYWGRTPYDPTTLPARPEGEYFERTLPGVPGNPVYPYLTESDFFEDKIMWLGYTVNKKKYFTGFNGDSVFLLPLKPTFFKYFKVEDLERMVKVNPEQPPLYPKVTVTIDIPVNGGNIRFSKTYEKQKDQYVDFPNEGSFKLGIFPFYTYSEVPSAREEDAYKILLARMSDVKLEFYNRDFVTPLGEDVVKSRIRTQSPNHNNITEYFTLGTHFENNNPGKPGTFTAIRVVKSGIGGMVIPKFHKATVSQDKYVFCVDFGTANTNVAYAKTVAKAIADGSVELRVTDAEIRTLDFEKNNPAGFDQMAMLNEEGSEGRAQSLNNYIFSEFVPEEIGKGEIKFPIRTIACTRSENINGQPQLFGDANIAFYTDKYGKTDGYSYQSELKWGQNTRRLTGAFFRELIWMCKNKVAELGGNPVFEFYFTYPQTMSNITAMINGWKEAANAVRTRAHVVDANVRGVNGHRLYVYEGIAPWYRAISLPEAGIFHNEDFLNIDIGGGSTDAIYITRPLTGDDKREMMGYSFSAKFAANDLWGDGVGGNADLTNGFLNVFENSLLPNLREEYKTNYQEYKRHATGSADQIGYLFSHREYEFKDLLTGDDKLRVPMLVHFAAIIYYVARTLAMQQLTLPKHISFSGMGSLYLKYITEDTEVLSDIIKAIFSYTGLKMVDTEGRARQLMVRFADNPKKITAEGGVLMFNTTRPGLPDKMVNSQELNFHIYNGEEDEEETAELNCGNVNGYQTATVREVEKFLGLFENATFRQAVNRLEGGYPKFDINQVKGILKEGFELAKTNEYPDAENDTQIKDVLFFWPLKHAIYMLTKEMANQSLASNRNHNNQ